MYVLVLHGGYIGGRRVRPGDRCQVQRREAEWLLADQRVELILERARRPLALVPPVKVDSLVRAVDRAAGVDLASPDARLREF